MESIALLQGKKISAIFSDACLQWYPPSQKVNLTQEYPSLRLKLFSRDI